MASFRAQLEELQKYARHLKATTLEKHTSRLRELESLGKTDPELQFGLKLREQLPETTVSVPEPVTVAQVPEQVEVAEAEERKQRGEFPLQLPDGEMFIAGSKEQKNLLEELTHVTKEGKTIRTDALSNGVYGKYDTTSASALSMLIFRARKKLEKSNWRIRQNVPIAQVKVGRFGEYDLEKVVKDPTPLSEKSISVQAEREIKESEKEVVGKRSEGEEFLDLLVSSSREHAINFVDSCTKAFNGRYNKDNKQRFLEILDAYGNFLRGKGLEIVWAESEEGEGDEKFSFYVGHLSQAEERARERKVKSLAKEEKHAEQVVVKPLVSQLRGQTKEVEIKPEAETEPKIALSPDDLASLARFLINRRDEYALDGYGDGFSGRSSKNSRPG